MQKSKGLTRQPRFRVVFAAPLLLIIALMGWALASPTGSSPDDDFHLASIWCAQGERESLCEATADPEVWSVPKNLTTAACFAFDASQSAACQEFQPVREQTLVETDRGNFQGDYPPLFYATMSIFVGPDIETSVVLMRIFNVLLFAGLVTAIYVFLPRDRRSSLAWGWVISSVPLVVFIVASINPSSWAVISGGTLWIALVGFFESRGKPRVILGALAIVSALIGSGARADSAIFTALGIAVAIVITAKRSRAYLLSLAILVPILALSAAFYFTSGQSTLVVQGIGVNPDPDSVDTGGLFASNLVNIPSLWVGMLGSWGLGWLDTPLPAMVSVGSLAVFVAVTFSGLMSVSIRKLIALAGVAFGLLAVPLYMLTQSKTQVGLEVQPRYLLPMLLILGGLAVFKVSRSDRGFTRVQRYAIVAILSVAHALALHVNIRRYVTGADADGWNLNAQTEWWWSFAPSAMIVWVIGSAAFAALLVVVVREVSLADARPRLGLRPEGEPSDSQG